MNDLKKTWEFLMLPINVPKFDYLAKVICHLETNYKVLVSHLRFVI